MRITIDVEGGSVRAAGSAERNAEDAVEAIDAGGPSAGLLEALALEGALGPVPAPDGTTAGSVTSAGPAAPTRTMWETDTLMRKRRD